MPSLPPRTERPPSMSELDGNKDNASHDHEMNDGPNGGAASHDKKIAKQQDLMMVRDPHSFLKSTLQTLTVSTD